MSSIDDRIEERWRYDGLCDQVYDQILSWLSIPLGAAVLDVGCGTGDFAFRLSKAVGEHGSVLGIDIDRESIDEGEKKDRPANLRLYVGDVRDLKPETFGEFDTIWASRALHGELDAAQALTLLFGILKPGGRIIVREGGVTPPRFFPISTTGTDWGLESRVRLYKDANMSRHHDNTSHRTGWRKLLGDAGFSNVSTRSFLQELVSPLPEAVIGFLKFDLQRVVKGFYDDAIRDRLPLMMDQLDCDKAIVQRLLNPADPAYLFNRTDLHLLHVLTVHVAFKPD